MRNLPTSSPKASRAGQGPQPWHGGTPSPPLEGKFVGWNYTHEEEAPTSCSRSNGAFDVNGMNSGQCSKERLEEHSQASRMLKLTARTRPESCTVLRSPHHCGFASCTGSAPSAPEEEGSSSTRGQGAHKVRLPNPKPDPRGIRISEKPGKHQKALPDRTQPEISTRHEPLSCAPPPNQSRHL